MISRHSNTTLPCGAVCVPLWGDTDHSANGDTFMGWRIDVEGEVYPQDVLAEFHAAQRGNGDATD